MEEKKRWGRREKREEQKEEEYSSAHGRDWGDMIWPVKIA